MSNIPTFDDDGFGDFKDSESSKPTKSKPKLTKQQQPNQSQNSIPQFGENNFGTGGQSLGSVSIGTNLLRIFGLSSLQTIPFCFAFVMITVFRISLLHMMIGTRLSTEMPSVSLASVFNLRIILELVIFCLALDVLYFGFILLVLLFQWLIRLGILRTHDGYNDTVNLFTGSLRLPKLIGLVSGGILIVVGLFSIIGGITMSAGIVSLTIKLYQFGGFLALGSILIAQICAWGSGFTHSKANALVIIGSIVFDVIFTIVMGFILSWLFGILVALILVSFLF